MSGEEKTIWDGIPSINLGIDESHSDSESISCDRRYPRTDLTSLNKVLDKDVSYLPVKMATIKNGQCKGMILDFSENGCRIAAPVQLNEGELVKVGFIVNKRTIVTKAVVRWVSPQRQVDLVGIKFEDIPNDAKEFLRVISAVAMLDIVAIEQLKQVFK